MIAGDLPTTEDVVDLLAVAAKLGWTLHEYADRVMEPHKYVQEMAHVRGADHVRGTNKRAVCAICDDEGTLECDDCGCVPGIDRSCGECLCHAPKCPRCGFPCDGFEKRSEYDKGRWTCSDCDALAKDDADNARVDQARDA